MSAIAEHIIQSLKEHGHRPIGVEGLEKGRWVLIDYGDVVIHVFEQPLRGYYDLDGMWVEAKRTLLDGPRSAMTS